MATDRPPGELIARDGNPARCATTRAAAVFALLALTVYARNLSVPLVIDDAGLIRLCGEALRARPSALLAPDLAIFWRPVVKVLIALESQIWGFDPRGYHVTNLAWHVLASTLVFALARRWAGSRRAGWVAGLVFCLHPLNYYAVNWTSARYDLVSTVLVLAALIALADHVATRRARPALLFLLAEALALFAKELAFVLPVLAVLLAASMPGEGTRARLRRHAPVLAASFLLLAAVLGLRLLVMGRIGGPVSEAGETRLFENGPIRGSLYMLAVASVLMLHPVVREVDVGPAPTPLLAAGSIALAVVLLLLWKRAADRRRALAPFLAMWVACAPFAGYVRMTYSLQGAYLFYLATAFFTVGTGMILATRRRRVILPWIAAALPLVFVPMLAHNNARFRDAARAAGVVHDEVVRRLGDVEAGTTVLLWNIPPTINGVPLYFREIRALFADRPELDGVKFLVATGERLSDIAADMGLPGTTRVFAFERCDGEDGVRIVDRTAELGEGHAR